MTLIDMLKMKMNEEVDIDKATYIRRVPGGWLYTCCLENERGNAVCSSFVSELKTN